MENNINILLDKLQKAMIISGGKVKSTKLLSKLLKDFSKSKSCPKAFIEDSFDNVAPLFLLKTQKKGKKVVQTPIPLTSKSKSFSIGARWLVKNAKKHNKQSFNQNLVIEFHDSYKNRGLSKKQQQELNKLVVLNRAALSRR